MLWLSLLLQIQLWEQQYYSQLSLLYYCTHLLFDHCLLISHVWNTLLKEEMEFTYLYLEVLWGVLSYLDSTTLPQPPLLHIGYTVVRKENGRGVSLHCLLCPSLGAWREQWCTVGQRTLLTRNSRLSHMVCMSIPCVEYRMEYISKNLQLLVSNFHLLQRKERHSQH